VERVDLEPEGTLDAAPKRKPGIEDVLRRLDEIEQRLPAGEASSRRSSKS
jgi:hypothetical protein